MSITREIIEQMLKECLYDWSTVPFDSSDIWADYGENALNINHLVSILANEFININLQSKISCLSHEFLIDHEEFCDGVEQHSDDVERRIKTYFNL